MSSELARVLAYGGEPDGPILVCTPTELRVPDPVEGLEAVVVDADSPVADIRENLEANERGFDRDAAAVAEQTAEAFRDDLRGGQAVTLRWRGTAVGAGMHLPVRDAVTKLSGIATLVEHRNRGIGAAATTALCQLAFARGAELVFLSTSNPVARRLYERLGFRPPAA